MNSSGQEVYKIFKYLHSRNIHCVNYMQQKTYKEICNQINQTVQGGLNEKETELVLCSISSILTFNKLYLFAQGLLIP